MQLPVRILARAGEDRVVSVDGAFDAPGLNLSHWPGNRTPAGLRRDLSTGVALAFARLDGARRAELAAGCVALVNNHYDTDGLCAMFAVRHPREALELEQELLAAAAAGDFFAFPSRESFLVDAIVAGCADPELSPWRDRFEGLSDNERHELCTLELLERLPGILRGDFEPWRSLWEAPLGAVEADRADLSSAARDDLVHLDVTIWTAAPGMRSSRAAPATELFDPGRHALFGSTDTDRVLVIGETGAGTTCRFVIGTRSWFDPIRERHQPRPDVAALTEELNAAEGRPSDGAAWHHQDLAGASPELWFGVEPLPHFEEHAGPCLRASRLDPALVKAKVVEALRACWVFPDETAEPGEVSVG